MLGADSSPELIIYDVLCSPVAPTESKREGGSASAAGVFTGGEAARSNMRSSLVIFLILQPRVGRRVYHAQPNTMIP